MLKTYRKSYPVGTKLNRSEKQKLDYFCKANKVSRADVIRALIDCMDVHVKYQRPNHRDELLRGYSRCISNLNMIQLQLHEILTNVEQNSDSAWSDEASIQLNTDINTVQDSANQVADTNCTALIKELRLDGDALDKVIGKKQDFHSNVRLIKRLDATKHTVDKVKKILTE